VELLRFKYDRFGRPPPSWISQEVDLHNSVAADDSCTILPNLNKTGQCIVELLKIRFWGVGIVALFSQIWGTELYQSLREHRAFNDAPRICFRFHTHCSISKRGRLKEVGRKSRPNFGLFMP